MRLTVSEVARITGAKDCPNASMLLRAVTDSRECRPGDLFAAIVGARADGHAFALQAQKNGAAAILAERPLPEADIPVLVVENTINSLRKLASAWRGKYAGKVIALTGTAGKTTLKDALSAILAQGGAVNATEGNHNNQLGAALTILNGSGEEDFWLLEAGISHDGDMDELGEMLAPSLAIILNAAEGHTEGLGANGVAWHKARLLAWLQKDGIALVNGAYPDLRSETEKYARETVYFSGQCGDSEAVCNVCEKSPGVYEIVTNNERRAYHTPYYGEWGAEIAACAAMAAKILGLEPEQIQRGFNSAKMPAGRLNIIRHKQFEILDDSYNANPLSMRRMLETASAMAKSLNRPWIAILGEMGELGDIAAKSHGNLGKLLGKLQPALLVWKGGWKSQILEGIQETAGKNPFPFFHVNSVEEFESLINETVFRNLLARNAVALFKGSRFNHMEELVNAFMKLDA